MKVKVTQEGFEGYTGQMGVTQFVDGVSINDVSPRDAARMSAVMQVHWEDGTSCNPAQRLLDEMNTAAAHLVPFADNKDEVVTAPVVEKVEVKKTEPVEKEAQAYTREDLESIADAKGITGLREIGQPLGIKSNSINGLIEELLKAGAKVV